jgi:hypothetical protein
VDSPGSSALALSGTPQQRKDKNPFFFGCLDGPPLDIVGLVFAGEPSAGLCCVMDILLLVALPFRRRPRMLPFDSFDLPPMLSLGSLMVAPLSPVDVGDGCILCKDDLDGTWRRPRFFFEATGASSAVSGKLFSFSSFDKTVASKSSVLAVFCAVNVAWVEELGG